MIARDAHKPSVAVLSFTRSSPTETASGLLGWVTCTYGHLRLDGITLRRTLDGRITISFPEKRDRSGRSHSIVRPVDARARAAIEDEILQGLPVARGGRP